MVEYKTIRDVLKCFEIDQLVPVSLRSGSTVHGTVMEWDWDGDVLCLLTEGLIHEIRIDAIECISRER
jgi:hypothetical protein